MIPPAPRIRQITFSRKFFEVADGTNPKPKTLAVIAADTEFPYTAADRARRSAQGAGLEIVYDKTYPPADDRLHPDRARDRRGQRRYRHRACPIRPTRSA